MLKEVVIDEKQLPLEGYAFAYIGSQAFFGKHQKVLDKQWLEPAYLFRTVDHYQGEGPRRQLVGISREIRPILGYVTMRRIPLPRDMEPISIDALTYEDRAQLVSLVEEYEKNYRLSQSKLISALG